MLIADKIKKLRKDNNMTQEDLADKLNVSRQTISKWETNVGVPDIDNIKAICNLFNISTDELLDYNNELVKKKKQFIIDMSVLLFGIIGFIGGILFKKGFIRKTKASLCIFGFLATFIIYGGIMNPASVIMWQNIITRGMIISAYIRGIPFDLIHALGTAFFLWFISEPMIDKLERIKVKYGLVER